MPNKLKFIPAALCTAALSFSSVAIGQTTIDRTDPAYRTDTTRPAPVNRWGDSGNSDVRGSTDVNVRGGYTAGGASPITPEDRQYNQYANRDDYLLHPDTTLNGKVGMQPTNSAAADSGETMGSMGNPGAGGQPHAGSGA